MASDAETNYMLSTDSSVDILTSDQIEGISTISVAAHGSTSASRRRIGVPSLWDRDSDLVKHTVFTAVDDLRQYRGAPGRHSLHELPSHRKTRFSGVWVAEPLTAPPFVNAAQKQPDYDNVFVAKIGDQSLSQTLNRPAKVQSALQTTVENSIYDKNGQDLVALPDHPLHFTLQPDEELSISISPQSATRSCPPSTTHQSLKPQALRPQALKPQALKPQALKQQTSNYVDINSNIDPVCFDLYSKTKTVHHQEITSSLHGKPRSRYNSAPGKQESSGFLITHKPQNSGDFGFSFSYSYESNNENYRSLTKVKEGEILTQEQEESSAEREIKSPNITGRRSSPSARVSLQNTSASLPGSSANPVLIPALSAASSSQISNIESDCFSKCRLQNKVLTPEDCYDNLNPQNQSTADTHHSDKHRMPAASAITFLAADMGGDKAQTLPRKFKLSKSEIYHSISTTSLCNVEYNPNAPQITREYVDHIMATSYDGKEEERDVWKTSTLPRRAVQTSPAIHDEVFMESPAKSPTVIGNSMLAEYFNKRKELSSLSELSSSSPVSIQSQDLNKHNKSRLNSFPENNNDRNAHLIENHSSGKQQTQQTCVMSNSSNKRYRDWAVSPRLNGMLTHMSSRNGSEFSDTEEDEQILQVVVTPTSYNDDTSSQPSTPRSPCVNNLDHNCNQTSGNLSSGGYTLVNGSCSRPVAGHSYHREDQFDSVFADELQSAEGGEMESDRKLAEHQLVVNEIRWLEYQLQRVSLVS